MSSDDRWIKALAGSGATPPDMLPDLPAAALDDDGAEHRAYLRGVAEGRGAVCALLRLMLAQSRAVIVTRILGELLAAVEADGQADPAGVERGRAACLANITAYLRTFSALDDRSPEAWATTIERHEAELKAARDAERQGARVR